MKLTDGQNEKLISFGITLWGSFLWAGIATTLFFATFDPVELAEVATFPMQISRLSGYSAGFLLFWLLLVLNSLGIRFLSRSTLGLSRSNGDKEHELEADK